MEMNLENTVAIPLERLHRILQENDLSFGYPAYFSEAPTSSANDLSGTISTSKHPNYPGSNLQHSVAVFSTRGMGGPVFDICLVSGPSIDPNYLQASSKLRRLLQAEEIPFRDNTNIQKIRQEAITYAQNLLKTAENL